MWLQSSYSTKQKLRVLDEGFVVLVGNVLVENLPQHRLLLQEQSRLKQMTERVQKQKSELLVLQAKLIEKTKALREDRRGGS